MEFETLIKTQVAQTFLKCLNRQCSTRPATEIIHLNLVVRTLIIQNPMNRAGPTSYQPTKRQFLKSSLAKMTWGSIFPNSLLRWMLADPDVAKIPARKHSVKSLRFPSQKLSNINELLKPNRPSLGTKSPKSRSMYQLQQSILVHLKTLKIGNPRKCK